MPLKVREKILDFADQVVFLTRGGGGVGAATVDLFVKNEVKAINTFPKVIG